MTNLNFAPGTVFHMDNLEALRGMNSNTIDLIATDPPFNTGRNRESVGGKYVDQFRWGDNVHYEWMDQMRERGTEGEALIEVVEAAMHAHSLNLGAFLCFMGVRLLEMKRVLKPTGSIYVHMDSTAGHYVKAAMDAVFGEKNFRNEIVWCYTGPNTPHIRQFPRKHDSIFWYAKTGDWAFNKDHVRVPYKESTKSRLNYDQAYFKEGEGDQSDRAEVGKIPEDWWDIPRARGKERTGWPDQKPIALYERIVLASSNPGDLVLDPFCGCGTTILAAKKNDRQWVGIDRSDDARKMILCNLAGIKKEDLEDNEGGALFGPAAFDGMLAQHEAHFTTKPPVRTDDGEMAAPALGQVYAPEKKAALFSKERMRQILFEEFGPQCWGCNYEAPADAGDRQVRYLELDHINPKAQGGVDDLHNRGLCCPPCNQTKGMRYTMVGLRQEVLGRDWKKHPIDLVAAEKWCRQRIREEKRRDNQ